MNRVLSVFLVFVSSMALCASAVSAADLIIKPTAVALTDTTEDSNRPAINTINGGGFSGAEQTALETGAVVPTTWPDVDTGTYTLNQRSSRGSWNDSTATYTLTLHGSDSYAVSGIHLWNYLEASATSRGTQTFTIDVSPDNSAWTAVNGGASYNILRLSEDADAIYGETFSFGATYSDIQYVRINITATVNYPGFDEIRLIQPALPGALFTIR